MRLACERVLNKQSAGLVIVVEGNANGQFSASGHDERPGGFDFGKCLLVAHRLRCKHCKMLNKGALKLGAHGPCKPGQVHSWVMMT